MNNQYSNGNVYNVISNVANSFFQQLIGSSYWKIKEDYTISGNFFVSGIKIGMQIREFMKPTGEPVLPCTPINPQFLNTGSYFGIVTVQIPNERPFTIQVPHNKPENFMHLQKGKTKIEIPPNPNDITNFGLFASGLFLKFCTKDQAISYIDQIREAPTPVV